MGAMLGALTPTMGQAVADAELVWDAAEAVELWRSIFPTQVGVGNCLEKVTSWRAWVEREALFGRLAFGGAVGLPGTLACL